MNPENKTAKALTLLEKTGFIQSTVTVLTELMIELDEIIRSGENEYGGSTVSTSESRRYEQASLARGILFNKLKQLERETPDNSSIIYSIIEHNANGKSLDTSIESAVAA